MRTFQPTPTPRYGRDDLVRISDLFRLKSVADKWKQQLLELKGPMGKLVKHANSLEPPTIRTFKQLDPEDAILLPLVRGKLFNFEFIATLEKFFKRDFC